MSERKKREKERQRERERERKREGKKGRKRDRERERVDLFVNGYSGSCEPCPLCQSLLSTPTKVPWQQPLCVNSESSCTRCFSDVDVLSESCGRVLIFLLSQFLTVVPEAESSDPNEHELVL